MPLQCSLPPGQSFAQAWSNPKYVAQYSPGLQHVPSHTTLLRQMQFSLESLLLLPQM